MTVTATAQFLSLIRGGVPEAQLGAYDAFVRDLVPHGGAAHAARLPVALINRAWAFAQSLAGAAPVALAAAARVSEGAFGLVEYHARTARTLGEAFEAIAASTWMTHDASSIDLVDTGDGVGVRQSTRWPSLDFARWGTEMTVALLARFAREMAGDDAVREVRFSHVAPADAEQFAAALGCRVSFGQDVDTLVLAPAALGAPLPDARAPLHRLLGETLAREGGERAAACRWESRVALEIRRRLLDRDELDLTAVAAALSLSTRALQRRLIQEHVTFEAIVDDQRRVRAGELLRAAEDPLIVAEEIGFSDESKFKRWLRRRPAIDAPRQAP
jgi:AraC-like DNA-binding protein